MMSGEPVQICNQRKPRRNDKSETASLLGQGGILEAAGFVQEIMSIGQIRDGGKGEDH